MMGIVIALGFGAAFFLVSNGFQDPVTQTDEMTAIAITEMEGKERTDREVPAELEQKFANIEASIAADPGDRARAYQYGIALIGLGELKRAEKFYRQQLEFFPDDFKIAYALGRCHEQLKQWSEAVQAYELACHLNPTHPDAKGSLAWVLATAPDASVRNGQRAVILATQAIGGRTTTDPKRMDILAAAYAEAGLFENAVKLQRYVSDKTGGENSAFEQRLKLYLDEQPYRMPR